MSSDPIYCVCNSPKELSELFKKHDASNFYSEKWFQRNYNFCAQQLMHVYPSHKVLQEEIQKIC